jgi:hypothetical protein
MTAAVARRLERPSLLAALRERSTYATTGARILLEFTAAGLPMGAVGQGDEVVCCGAVHGEGPLALLEIVKDGKVAWHCECDDLDATIRWRDPAPPCKEHYYYLHVVQADGQMAWSSPIWIGPA